MPSEIEVSHINHALIAKGHPPRHLIHKFWARKPHNVVAEYIRHYTNEGDIVLDPFCGSGVTPIESLILNRKAIAIDLNPIATFITRMTLTPVDLGELKNKFKEIEEKVRDKILDFYVTVCPKCGRKAIVLASIWRITEPNPFELRLLCLNCNKKFKKSPTEDDILKLREVEHEKPCWYPENKLKYPNGVEFKEGTHKTEIDSIDKLFTKRNLISLSLIYREIESIDDELHRDMFKFAFTSMVHLASKLCPVAKPSERAHWSEFSATSFWAQHRYWIPPIFMESNVWMLFESAFYGRQGLLKGKEDSNENISYLKEAKKFEDFEKGANILISTQSALDLSNIPDNSVDYVFTDPPYGGGYTIF